MSGAFEVVQSTDERRGHVLQQTGVGYPVIWLRNDVLPYTQVGDVEWRAVNASVEIALPPLTRRATSGVLRGPVSGAVSGTGGGAGSAGGGAAFLAVRLDGRTTDAAGLFFGVDKADGSWFLAPSLTALAARNRSFYIAHGPLPSVEAPAGGGATTWHKLKLNVTASGVASGSIDRRLTLPSLPLHSALSTH
jgi:hypothetical protein